MDSAEVRERIDRYLRDSGLAARNAHLQRADSSKR